ncbi:MAG TPA: HAMP domain-containing sensor histidine kinase [Rhodocyclaceae bacterium]
MRPLDLKRSLLLRISLFALALFFVAAAVTLEQARLRIRQDIPRIGATMGQLITDEINRSRSPFDRTNLGPVDLSGLAGIGNLVHFCAELVDIYGRDEGNRCFAADDKAPAPIRKLMEWAVGNDAVFHGIVGQYPGINVGELRIRPNFDSEANDYLRQLRNLFAITVGVLLLNVLVYVPVRRALQPTEEILDTLERMEAGDLGARMPSFPLIELQRIGAVFNHLAERLQQTMSEQRQLAERLLEVREEERRHLARELHDEFGQCLASIQAEAAYVDDLGGEKLAEVRPSAQAISRTTAHMMEVLQQMLRHLRPVGLDEFGLVATLEQLVDNWNRRGACAYRLTVEGDFAALPENLPVSLYRIVQESVTNASRHSRAGEIAIRLCRNAGGIKLLVEDDGNFEPGQPAGQGFGLLGMRERVQALGGQIAFEPRQPRGLRVRVDLPLENA